MKKDQNLNPYHFRKYKISKNHPFLVVLVKVDGEVNEQILLSGFNLTRSKKIYNKKRNKYIKIQNPNPNDNADSYLCLDIVMNRPLYYFTGPLIGWELSKKDKKRIKEIIKLKIKTPRRS